MKIYEYDGKSILKLSNLQKKIKSQIETKINNGIYKFEKINCEICNSKKFVPKPNAFFNLNVVLYNEIDKTCKGNKSLSLNISIIQCMPVQQVHLIFQKHLIIIFVF